MLRLISYFKYSSSLGYTEFCRHYRNHPLLWHLFYFTGYVQAEKCLNVISGYR